MRRLQLSLSILALSTLSACGNFAPSINESGFESGRLVLPSTPPAQTGSGDQEPAAPSAANPAPAASQFKAIALNQATNLRYNKANVLEFLTELPKDAEILVPENYQYVTWNYRGSDGKLTRSSTGFIGPVKVRSSPGGAMDAGKIDTLNKTDGGLFISASVVNRIGGIDGNFAAISPASPASGFLSYYQATGRPKNSYRKKIVERFGARVDAGIEAATLSAADRTKWEKIFHELQLAADRTVATPKSIIMTTIEEATRASTDYEKTGRIALNGAWTIATEATAVRHGFANAPCAETMSEFIRQAYTRAGYAVTEDFNATKGNRLIYSETAAVVGLSRALAIAGWVPWDATLYRPPVGAILMNEYGQTPGHTYIAAGADGSIIVDNGAPQGRDLHVTTGSSIGNQYQTGLFFLPPGLNPRKW